MVFLGSFLFQACGFETLAIFPIIWFFLIYLFLNKKCWNYLNFISIYIVNIHPKKSLKDFHSKVILMNIFLELFDINYDI
jgi:hypothetical protein